MTERRLRLRPHTEADLPNYVEWLNDPEVTEFTALESGGVTLEGEREWFAHISDPECRDRNWAIEACGRHIGNCALHPDGNGQTAGFGIIIGDRRPPRGAADRLRRDGAAPHPPPGVRGQRPRHPLLREVRLPT